MSDTKTCRYCAMEVPKKAIICPHCRKTIGTSSTTMGCAVIFVLLAFVGLISWHESPPLSSLQEKNTVQSQEPLTPKGKKIKTRHSSWDNEICNTVGEHKVHAGMTTEQAQAAWGKPYKINETYIGNRKSEQWVMYEDGNSYLYFDDGILTSFQRSTQ
jgi:hypothetical protein